MNKLCRLCLAEFFCKIMVFTSQQLNNKSVYTLLATHTDHLWICSLGSVLSSHLATPPPWYQFREWVSLVYCIFDTPMNNWKIKYGTYLDVPRCTLGLVLDWSCLGHEGPCASIGCSALMSQLFPAGPPLPPPTSSISLTIYAPPLSTLCTHNEHRTLTYCCLLCMCEPLYVHLCTVGSITGAFPDWRPPPSLISKFELIQQANHTGLLRRVFVSEQPPRF